ncbi:MAG: MFS transporter, partial [Planctomycetota bacterium]
MNSENNNLAAIDPTKAQKIHSLPWALGAHTGNAIYTNLVLAGPVFMLFLAKLDLDETRISVILSITPFLSVLSIIFGPLGAKFGYKRSFIFLWAIRKFVLIFLVATPFLLANYGIDTVFVFIISVLALFALCNTAAISWLEPWMHEFIPDTVRSKFSAVSNITGVLASTLTLIAAGSYIGHKSEVSEFIILFVIAFIIGLISAFFYLFVPGGEPKKQKQKQAKVSVWAIFRNGPFIRFLLGGAFLVAGWTAVNPGGFLTLFLNEEMKFDPEQITFIVSTIMGVGLISSYLWGWVADRYGSKPIMLICLAFHGAFPLLLCLVQGNFKHSFYLVLGISALIGLGLPGWGISFSRYLYVNLVLPENRSQYLSFNLAFTGLVGGISPLIVGFILSRTARLNIAVGWFQIGHYTPLLIWSALMIGIGFVILSKLPNDASVSTAKFVSMFTQGHPFLAMQAIYQHSRGGANQKRLLTIKRLADAHSPLAADELLETLRDPSVCARVQAINSIASTQPVPRL